MHIKNILRQNELNPWKKHEHIMDTQGASNKKKEEIKITKLKYFCLFENFQNKMHTKNQCKKKKNNKNKAIENNML